MTIARDSRNKTASKDFVIVGVGGAGSNSATELSKVLGNPDDVISVDREMEDLRSFNVGRRLSIGYPLFVSDENDYEENLVDSNDLFRLKTLIGKPPIVFVMAGLGGVTTQELMPSVLHTAMSSGASVLAIVTLPFAFEGRTRVAKADSALQRIRETGCSLAVIDADNALSAAAFAGDLASELTATKARVVMNVLSASSVGTSGTLNSAPQLLDAIRCGGETFVSYACADDASEYRKVAREAVKHPITSGLELTEADRVSVIVAGPREMSIKHLNAAIGVVQAETSPDAVLSTSFIANEDSPKAGRLRISILAGRSSEPQIEVFGAKDLGGETEMVVADVSDSAVAIELGVVADDADNLFGAPDWLIDQPVEDAKVPALL